MRTMLRWILDVEVAFQTMHCDPSALNRSQFAVGASSGAYKPCVCTRPRGALTEMFGRASGGARCLGSNASASRRRVDHKAIYPLVPGKRIRCCILAVDVDS